MAKTNRQTWSEPDIQKRLGQEMKSVFGEKVRETDPLKWKYGRVFTVDAGNLKEVVKTLRDHEKFLFNMLVDVTAVDWLDKREPRFEVVYHLLSLTFHHRITLKVGLDEEDPTIDSVRDLYPAANFLEREVFDMYGITFAGHGDLRRILMYDEFVGYPLRKDYPIRGKQPRVKLRIPEMRNDSEDMHRQELVSLLSRPRLHKALQKGDG